MLVAGLLTSLPAAHAATLSPGTVGDFEDDGNMVLDAGFAGSLDWANTAEFRTAVTDDTLDSGLQGSSKENEPENWKCNVGGDDPSKNDILRAYVNTRIYGPPDQNPPAAYLDMAYVRATGTGDAHVNFEFNQNEITNPCPFTGRTEGDLLVVFDFPGGDKTANIQTFSWDPDAPDGSDNPGKWIEFDLPAGAAAGASNASAFTDAISGDSIVERGFGEATIDLVALDSVVPGDLLSCPGFGSLNIRSRSSGESFNAALQDRMPQTPIDLSTCGSVKIAKTDDAGNALPGAQFGLFDNANATGDPVKSCTTDAEGECTFTEVTPGDYWMKEIAAPAGYDPDPDIVAVTVGFREEVDLTDSPFEDPRHVGHLRVHKVLRDQAGAPVTPDDASDLDGATFLVYDDANGNDAFDAGEEAHLWPNPPADGSDLATCTVSGGTGSCDIGPLATGDYRLTETASPPGTTWAGDFDVTITETTADQPIEVDGPNVLSAIEINLDKAGPGSASVGDTITYTFGVSLAQPTPLHNIVLSDDTGVCDSDPAFQSGDDGDNVLEPGETWRYTCPHEVTLNDPDPLVNTACVEGTDDFGRTDDDCDDHNVDILYPDVAVTKVPVDGAMSAGDEASYTITVTNNGPGIARSVTLTDALPEGVDWSIDPVVDGCSVAAGTLACDFGDLADGDTRVITIKGVTDAEDCGVLTNTVVVDASNEPENATQNNTATATITVDCPDVTIVKEAVDETIAAGQDASFTITVTNEGEGTAYGVTVTDELPAGITWTLSGEDAEACQIANDVLTCEFGDLGPGESRSVTVTGTTTEDGCGNIENVAVVEAANEPEDAQDDNEDGDNIDVLCEPDVVVLKDPVDPSVNAGDDVAFTITVGNGGFGVAEDVKLVDELPEGVEWTLDGPDAGDCAIENGVLICDFGDLASGENKFVAVRGTTDVADCGDLVNLAEAVAANEPEELQDNNADDAVITVTCPPDQPRPEIPKTGAEVGALPLIGLGLIFAGALLVLATGLRRPRRPDSRHAA